MDSVVDLAFCTAETTNGKVRGLVTSGIRQFKGVPYGASTAGANRFKRPRLPAPWCGVRDCFGYGPASPQLPSDIGNDYARLVQFDLNVALGGMSEDCLQLNIWTPGTGAHEKRAVLFSVHGGGFAIGSGNNPLYDGARLAYFGDVVVVTVTHRLASFGFLNLAAMDRSGEWADSGACGILAFSGIAPPEVIAARRAPRRPFTRPFTRSRCKRAPLRPREVVMPSESISRTASKSLRARLRYG